MPVPKGTTPMVGLIRIFRSPARTISLTAMMSSTIPPAIMKSSTRMPSALKTARPRNTNPIVINNAVRMDWRTIVLRSCFLILSVMAT